MKSTLAFAALGLLAVGSAYAKPTWNTKPIFLPDAKVGVAYTQDLSSFVNNPDGDPVVCSGCGDGVVGWATLTSTCKLTGTPAPSDVGVNICDVSVSDGKSSEEDTTTAQINVTP